MSATSSTNSVLSNPLSTQTFTIHLKSDQRINFVSFSHFLRLGDPLQVSSIEITALREEQLKLNADDSYSGPLTLSLKILESKCFVGWALTTCLHTERNDHSIRCTMTFTGVELAAYTAQIPLISEIARASIYKNEPTVIRGLRHRRHRHRELNPRAMENPFLALMERASAHRRRHRSRSRPSLNEE